MSSATTFKVAGYEVPVRHRPDVCVVGAGPAGISAAIAAARCGLQVLLIEKYGFSGGATVAGLSGTICGLFASGVDKPEQIVFGFADEFYRKLQAHGGVQKPVTFGKTYLLPHDAFVWKTCADDLLEAAGVTVKYHTRFLNAYTDEAGRVETLLVTGLEGQYAVQPGYVVDASGDAAVVDAVRGATYLGADGTVQTPTMIFKMGNVDTEAFLKIAPHTIDEAVIAADKAGDFDLPRHHVYVFPSPNTREVICNMTRITYPDGRTPLGIDSDDMTYAEIAGRRQARAYCDFLRERIAPFRDAHMVDTGVQVGIRQSRSIVGHQQLKNDDVLQARKFSGAVTHSAWPIENHGAGALRIVYLENDHYDVPFETLQPTVGTNLLVAGRCMSAEHEALASARVTGQCFGMGYAVGAACGLMRHNDLTSQQLSGTDVLTYMAANKLKNSYEQ